MRWPSRSSLRSGGGACVDAARGVIQPLGADGSVPFDNPSTRRWSDRTILVVIAVAVLVLASVVGGFVLVNGHDAKKSVSTATGTTPSTTQDGRDLSQVSNDEMETVVAANPDVVPMRLALVERYLRAADAEQSLDGKKAQLERARFHAGEAAASHDDYRRSGAGAALPRLDDRAAHGPAKGRRPVGAEPREGARQSRRAVVPRDGSLRQAQRRGRRQAVTRAAARHPGR